MFTPQTYKDRRRALKDSLGHGLVLFLGNEPSPMNYVNNVYPFVQDSSFLYFWGGDLPGQAGLMDLDSGRDLVFGRDPSTEEMVWSGPLPGLAELRELSGAERALDMCELEPLLRAALAKGREVLFLPPYRGETKLKLAELLGIDALKSPALASERLIRAAVALREIKSADEVAQIEEAVDLTSQMILYNMASVRPGHNEREMAYRADSLAGINGPVAFYMILTGQGQYLHIEPRNRALPPGELVVQDCGARSALHYAADLTRTFPVNGRFSPKQKEIYQVVYEAQEAAIAACAPGCEFRDVHMLAARRLAEGLRTLGLMKGDPARAVEQGAHTLFFPCGVGHALGLDVHDMESFGEDYVGYTDAITRDPRFGFNRLRLAKPLKDGMVVTIEPGIYFTPGLIAEWRAQRRLAEFIDYDAVATYMEVGGVRIEDDVLITKDGYRVLGEPLAKTLAQVEEITLQAG